MSGVAWVASDWAPEELLARRLEELERRLQRGRAAYHTRRAILQELDSLERMAEQPGPSMASYRPSVRSLRKLRRAFNRIVREHPLPERGLVFASAGPGATAPGPESHLHPLFVMF